MTAVTPASRARPLESQLEVPGCRCLQDVVLRQRHPMASRPRQMSRGAPYWSEAPFLVEQLGIPTVYCAPGDISNCHTLEEHVDLQEYRDGIIAFAAFLARFGELDPQSFQPARR